VRKGDRVAVLLPNGPKFPERLLTCTRLGAIFLPVNTCLAPAEVLVILGDTKRLVYHADLRSTLEAFRGEAAVRGVVQVGSPR
jgi:fatty-acyl-CoA synthase